MNSQKSLILAILIIIIAISIAGWVVLLRGFKPEPNDNANTANANISNTNIANSNLSNINASTNENTNSQPIDTSNWQTYRNEELGFEVKYPKELKATENNPNYNFKPGAKNQSNVSFDNDQIINNCGCGIYVRIENNEKLLTIDDWFDSDEEKNDNYISQKQYNEKKNSPDEITRILAGQYNEGEIMTAGILSLRQNYALEGGGYDRILIPVSGKIYVVTARSDNYYFNKKESQKDGGELANIFEEMIRSFRLF